MATIKPISVPAKRLSQTITGSASSFKLDNILGWDGVTNLAASDFGTKAYAAFRNAAGTLIEFMEIDPSTIASASITILRRGLKYNGDDLTTEVSANKLTWVKGDTIVELGTHMPQLLAHYVDIVGAQTIAGIKTFTSPPVVPTPVGNTDAANKAYVNSVVAGIATTVNVIVPGTAGETIVAGELIYFDDTDNEWKKCDADTAATVENALLGIAQGGGTDGVAISGGVLLRGLDSNQTGLTAGAIYYASNTAGGISSSAGTKEVTVGFSYSTTQLYFNPRFNQQLTEDQQDALAGSSGTPSTSNKYVTEDDVSAAAASGKIVRATGTALPALSGANLTNLPGTKKAMVAGETINGATLPVPVYFNNTDDEFYACDANVQTKLQFIGFATSNGTDGNALDVQFTGIVSGFSGLTVGAPYYVQDAVGTIGTTVGTYEVYVGVAVSATELYIDLGNRGSWQYMGTDAVSVSSGNTVYTAPADARFAIITGSFTTGSSNSQDFSCVLAKIGATSHSATFDGPNAGDDGSYSLVWGASGITVTESSDPNADGSISANIYWYR